MKQFHLANMFLAAGAFALMCVGCSSSETTPDVVTDVQEDLQADVQVDVQVDEGSVTDEGGDTADLIESDETTSDVEQPGLWEDLTATAAPTIERLIGVSTHMHQGIEESAERDFEFEKYAELGEVTIREDYHWHRIEPADDQWDFSRVQGQVDMAVEGGVRIIPMLGYEVEWAMTDPEDFSTINSDEYGEFAGRVAQEYCQYIKEYEIWNEENIPRFWGGEPDAAKYGDMLKAAHTAIKTACPDARVLLGGMSSYDAERDLTDRFGFLERLGQAHPDICDYFEIVAFHPYTFMQYDPPERDVIIDETLEFQGQTAQTEIVRAYLASLGCPDKALMVTEQGWPSYDLTEEQVGAFLPRSILLAARDGVESYMWYTFWDGYPETEGLRPHESYFGLFGWTGEDGSIRRAKPAWISFKAMADVLGDTRFARDLSAGLALPNDVYALAFVDESGRIVVAAWDGRDFPDQNYNVDGPGGKKTSFDLALPLPPGCSQATVIGIDGALLDAESTEHPHVLNVDGTEPVLNVRLTPSIIYITPTCP